MDPKSTEADNTPDNQNSSDNQVPNPAGQSDDTESDMNSFQPEAPTPGTSISPSSSSSSAPGQSPDPTEAAVEPAITAPEPPAAPAPPQAPVSAQVEESPDLPPQPPVLNKRIFTPPPEELLKKPSHKKRNLLIALFVLLILGGVGAYFGYYVPNKPENMWRAALVNTGKGYDKLIEYSEEAKDVKRWTQEAKFNIDGAVEADGMFKGENSGNASKTTGDISVMGTKIGLDVRTTPSATETPDVYFRVDGLEGLGTLLAQDDPAVETALNSLNNQWYVVDHTLFEQMEGATDPSQSITSQDVAALFKKIGVTSKEYVFTDDTEKAVVVIKDQIGRETKNDRSVYHYTVDTDDKQAQKYVVALCNDLKSSKIGTVFADSMGEDAINCNFESNSKQSSGDVQLKPDEVTNMHDVKDEVTVDAWVDTKTKLIHAIRFSDKENKKNYVELSQNFTGGDEMPFKIEVQNSSEGMNTSLTLDATFNTKTKAANAKGAFGFTDPSNDENNTTGDFSYVMKPANKQVEVEKPEGAKNIIELLNALGIGDVFANGGLDALGGSQAAAQDSEMKNNLKNLQQRLETYYNDKGYYPSLSQANAEAWIDTRLTVNAEETGYGYAPKSQSGGECNGSTVECQTFRLTALLTGGDTYTIDSLNE